MANKGRSHSSPLVAGTIQKGPTTIDSSRWVWTVWPQLPTATSYDILRVSYPGEAPYGTGNYAVASGLLPADVCGSNGVCSYQDTVTVPGSYTVGAANGSYYPSANFWPGDIVLMSNLDESNHYNVGSYQGPGADGGVVVNAAAYDTSHPHLTYLPGSKFNWQNNQNPISPGNVLAIGNNDSSNQLLPGILLPKYVPYGTALNRKGLINLGTFQDDRSGPTDLMTFYDSNYQKPSPRRACGQVGMRVTAPYARTTIAALLCACVREVLGRHTSIIFLTVRAGWNA